MIKIAVNYSLFAIEQNVFVYGEDVLKHLKISDDELPDSLRALQKQYNIKEINLIGNKDFLGHLKNKLITRFEKDECQINIIESQKEINK